MYSCAHTERIHLIAIYETLFKVYGYVYLAMHTGTLALAPRRQLCDEHKYDECVRVRACVCLAQISPGLRRGGRRRIARACSGIITKALRDCTENRFAGAWHAPSGGIICMRAQSFRRTARAESHRAPGAPRCCCCCSGMHVEATTPRKMELKTFNVYFPPNEEVLFAYVRVLGVCTCVRVCVCVGVCLCSHSRRDVCQV